MTIISPHYWWLWLFCWKKLNYNSEYRCQSKMLMTIQIISDILKYEWLFKMSLMYNLFYTMVALGLYKYGHFVSSWLLMILKWCFSTGGGTLGAGSGLSSDGTGRGSGSDGHSSRNRCRFCQKVFSSDSALQIHIRSHTGTLLFSAGKKCATTLPALG